MEPTDYERHCALIPHQKFEEASVAFDTEAEADKVFYTRCRRRPQEYGERQQ